MDNRTLTDEDVQAIAQQLEIGLTRKFQMDVGRGVLGLVWKAVVYSVIAIAAYGAGGGFRKFF